VDGRWPMSENAPRPWISDDSVDPLTALLDDLVARPLAAPFTCPVCTEPGSVHVHLHGFAGAVGGSWIWCSRCRRYDHDRRTIPAWWFNNSLIDLESLVSPPAPLDGSSDLIDQHWNLACGRGCDG